MFEGALESLLKLSTVVGPNLNPHLKVLLVPVSLVVSHSVKIVKYNTYLPGNSVVKLM